MSYWAFMTEETRDTRMAYFEGHGRKSVLRKTSIPIYINYLQGLTVKDRQKAENFVLFLSAFMYCIYSIMCNFEPHRFFFKKKVRVVISVSVEISNSYFKFPMPK